MGPSTLFVGAILLGLTCSSRGQAMYQMDRLNEIGPNEREQKGKDKCEIEIFTRGSCIINNSPLKPQVILTFDQKPNANKQQWHNKQTPNQDVNQDKLNIVNKDLNLKRKVVEEFVIRFVELMKHEYGKYLQPLVIEDIQFVKLKHWGDANIYNLKIFGLMDLKPVETKFLSEDNASTWRFTSMLQVANLTAQFKVDANIKNKIVIKNWNLMLLMERCLLQSSFEINFDTQVLKINSMHIKSFDNFQLVSESLSWPFNEIVSSIVNEEKYYIRHVIELNAQKYINMTLNQHLNLNSIIEKILRGQV